MPVVCPDSSSDRSSYGSFASFSDPDGNGWLIQEVTTRLPGRIDPGATIYASESDLAEALRRANGPREAREADWRSRSGLVRLVRQVHGGRAGRQQTADLIRNGSLIGRVDAGSGVRLQAGTATDTDGEGKAEGPGSTTGSTDRCQAQTVFGKTYLRPG